MFDNVPLIEKWVRVRNEKKSPLWISHLGARNFAGIHQGRHEIHRIDTPTPNAPSVERESMCHCIHLCNGKSLLSHLVKKIVTKMNNYSSCRYWFQSVML